MVQIRKPVSSLKISRSAVGKTDLSKFTIGAYKSGPLFKTVIWYVINYVIFDSFIPWPYRFKVNLLRLFGAQVGKNVIIKTKVRIKYPWRLKIGNNSWIGESCWLDNLAQVTIGDNVALSQGALLLTGNHDYTDYTFPYRLGEIILEDGVWIGAQAVVCPGVVCRSHSVLTVSSVATGKYLDAYGIFSGNPAKFIRQRKVNCGEDTEGKKNHDIQSDANRFIRDDVSTDDQCSGT